MATLIIAPHPDDELFWCFSALGKDTTVLQLSSTSAEPYVDDWLRKLDVARVIKNTFPVLGFDTRFDEMRMVLESVSGMFDVVYYPCDAYHQDHHAVWKAMKILTRPRVVGMFTEVYEYPYVGGYGFEGNVIRKVDKRKLDMLKKFPDGYWGEMVKTYNRSIGARYGLQGHYEEFKLMWRKVL